MRTSGGFARAVREVDIPPANLKRLVRNRAYDRFCPTPNCVVYPFTCGDTYIGETGRPLCCRVKEHLDGSNKLKAITPLVQILLFEPEILSRKTLEASWINAKNPNMNRKEECIAIAIELAPYQSLCGFEFEDRFAYVDMGINVVILTFTVIFYFGIFYSIRRTSRHSRQPAFSTSATTSSSNSSKIEIRLLVQFFTASLIYVLTWTCWIILPMISASDWMGVIMTSFFFLNTAVNPTIYLILNKSLRQKLFHLLCRKTPETSILQMSTNALEIKTFTMTPYRYGKVTNTHA